MTLGLSQSALGSGQNFESLYDTSEGWNNMEETTPRAFPTSFVSLFFTVGLGRAVRAGGRGRRAISGTGSRVQAGHQVGTSPVSPVGPGDLSSSARLLGDEHPGFETPARDKSTRFPLSVREFERQASNPLRTDGN